jgi:hypothetical protein
VYRHDGSKTSSFLGHFPVELCPRTPRIQALGGFVNYYNTSKGPPMGSGHFPDGKDDEKTAAFFRHVETYDSKGDTTDSDTYGMIPLVDKPNCYTETLINFDYDTGNLFYYGGPGCIG